MFLLHVYVLEETKLSDALLPRSGSDACIRVLLGPSLYSSGGARNLQLGMPHVKKFQSKYTI